MSASPLILLQAVGLTLTSRAGAVEILRDIDLSIDKGEAVGIVGPSGSGKSSLLSLMSGIERPSRGRVVIDGTALDSLDEDRLAGFRRDRIGIVFQSFHLLTTMTAQENVALPLELAGAAGAFARAAAALEQVGLKDRLKHYPSELSGGEQQRVAIARATIAQPPLILADEPTGNLDGRTGAQIVELLFSLRAKSGATLVLVTHDAGLAQACDRAIRIEDGRIVEDARRPAVA